MVIRTDNNLMNNCRAQFGLPAINLNLLTPGQIQVEYQATRNASYAFINANGGLLPTIAFPEEHPYPQTYPVNPTWNTFIIGTFPPVSYLRDYNFLVQPILLSNGVVLNPPYLPFYHGNVASMWNIIWPGIVPPPPIANRVVIVNNIITGLTQAKTNYFDVISECQRKKKNNNNNVIHYPSSDDSYKNIIPNEEEIVNLLTSPVEDILIIANTSSTFSTNGIQFNLGGNIQNPNNRAFDILLEVARRRGFAISFKLNVGAWQPMIPPNQANITAMMKTKVIFYLKVNEKIFTVVSPPSPSSLANLQLGVHPCYIQRYSVNPHPGYANTLNDFKRYVYQQAIARNFQNLWQINF